MNIKNNIMYVSVAFGIILSIFSIPVSAQIIRLDPPNPPVNVDVTVYYDASLGNKTLLDYPGDVYLHTGVITNKSIDGHDWKYVVGNWGKADKMVLMKREGKNLYSFKLKINTFYKLSVEDIAQQLAFVFRNEDGTIVGKTAENEDITVPVNGYKLPEKAIVRAVNPERRILSLMETATQGDSAARAKALLGDGNLKLSPKGWNVLTNLGLIMIQPITSNIVSVSFSPSGQETDDSSHSVVLKQGIVFRKTIQMAGGYLLQSGELSIYAQNQPYQLSFIYKGDTILKEEDGFFIQPENRGVRFRIGKDEEIYGAGERAVPMNRNGYRFPLYNRPFYGYEYGATMLNYSIPLTFSSKKYAVLFDNPQKGYVDIGKAEAGIQEWGTMGGPLRYYVIAGKDWPAIMSSYTELTGRQPLPPRWAFGNLQSRMAYRNQIETDSIVTLMQKKNFPMDAIILDFYWFGDSIQGHLGKLDWYKKAWPDPEGMIQKFKKQGIKTILITEPYVIDTVANYKEAAAKGVFVTDINKKPYKDKQFYFGTGSLIDIFKPAARDWFWSKYKKQIDIGVAAWWGDLGEPESHPSDIYHIIGKADEVHNIYGHYWDRMLFEKYAENYPSTRLFHLQRSGFAGSQRYSAFPWTGDVSRSWGGLKAQLPLLLTMGMSGLGYIHSDAGGFAQGVLDEELYTRWLQFAVFSPILRPHGSGIPSEPVYWSEKTQDIVRKYMELRYSLLPYNYTTAWQNASTGAPLMRPLFYAYPSDTIISRLGEQYLWGEAMMIAAITDKGLASKKIYFPEGKWFDFNSGTEYPGNQWVEIPLTIEQLPVFVKEGSFIPMMKPITSTDFYNSGEFIVKYYPSATSNFIQYEDDGSDNSSLKNKNFELISYIGKQDKQTTTINISKQGKWKGMPAERKMTFEIRRTTAPSKVLINGKDILKAHNPKPGKSSFQFNEGWLTLSFLWTGEPLKIEIIEPKSLKYTEKKPINYNQ